MYRWSGRVALVTGASSGIGAAICSSLANAGMKVVGVARNEASIESFKKLSAGIAPGKGSILPVKCDLRNDKEIEAVFETIKQKFGGLDLCINNAGLTNRLSLLDESPDQWREVMDVNVIALCYCSKLATQLMVEKGVAEGQIINIGSVVAHFNKGHGLGNFYAASKHAVKYLTQGLRQDIIERKYNIRVAGISPGYVKTEFAERAFKDNKMVLDYISKMASLKVEDITEAITYILSLPHEVEVNDIIIRPTGENF